MSDYPYVNKWGDKWGIDWKKSQSFRLNESLKFLKPILLGDNRKRILEIACALGSFTKMIFDINPDNEVTGTDISKKAIEICKTRYKNIDFRVDSLPDINFDKEYFDIIVAAEVLYYLNKESQITALKNIHDALKEGGFVLLSVIIDGGKRYFEKNEFINLFSEYFKIQDTIFHYDKLRRPIEDIFDSLRDKATNFLERNYKKNMNPLKLIKTIASIMIEWLTRFFLRYLMPIRTLNAISKLIWSRNAETRIILLGKKYENMFDL